MKTGTWIVCCMAALMVSCAQQGPQRPTQRKSSGPQVDSAQLALMALNQQLAESADEQIYRAMQEQEEPYALYEGGAWVTILHKGNTHADRLKQGDECAIHMQVLSLAGKLYQDTQQTICIGKHETLAVIEENIPEWHRGARVQMYVPWYSAFGIQGTAQIPPYENVIIVLDIR